MGTIALIAAFPSPGKLWDSVKPETTRISVSNQDPAVVIVQPAAYDDGVVTVEPPVDLRCASQLPSTSTIALEACAYQLANFIAQRSGIGRTSMGGQAAETGATSDVALEQARLALAQLCRVSWASKEGPSAVITRSCDRAL